MQVRDSSSAQTAREDQGRHQALSSGLHIHPHTHLHINPSYTYTLIHVTAYTHTHAKTKNKTKVRPQVLETHLSAYARHHGLIRISALSSILEAFDL